MKTLFQILGLFIGLLLLGMAAAAALACSYSSGQCELGSFFIN